MAKQQAAQVGDQAAREGKHVLDAAGDQTRRVADEAGRQARNLMHDARRQLTEQAQDGQRKAAESLHTLADQLDDMYTKSDQSGMAPEMINQAAGHTRAVASWLDDRRPGDLLDEVRAFARRKPGVFLAGAALAGVLVGRLTRGAIDAQSDDSADEKPSEVARADTDRLPSAVRPDAYPPSTVPPAYPPNQAPPTYTGQSPSYSQPPPDGSVPPGGYAVPPPYPAQPDQGTAPPPPWHGPGPVRS
ncbi:hypothetical protein AOZ06_29925 [Kibdelosporangium phytohabitans]|uniref:Uncharacterized protein n=1 Tax=Kibdelosporangium phytohabitans TaxID=860235 RepID=A0A0N9I7E5_9PSEU|nr:hypothetical protein AOZ06_29925 [Kibdelosporangium phytohabitans]